VILPPGDPVAPSLADCRVLVVDDNELNRVVAAAFLEKAGVGLVAQAADGAEALAMLDEVAPDLVVLDLMMPGMDGHEMLRHLRANGRHHDVPVLVVSALGGGAERTRAFALGATDYIEKPINGDEMIARARVHIANRLLVRRLTAYHEQSERDLAVLRATQTSLLPKATEVAATAERYGLTIDSFFRASTRVGGDLWGLFPLDEARLGLWMVDFSVHGVPAAINALRLHTILERAGVSMAHPPALLRDLDRQLPAMMAAGGEAAMVSVILDLEADQVLFAAAGEPRIFVGGADGVSRLKARGAALGNGGGGGYEASGAPLPKGGFLCLMTEAAARAASGPDECGLEAAVAAAAGHAAPLATLMGGVAGDSTDEDLTAIWVGRP